MDYKKDDGASNEEHEKFLTFHRAALSSILSETSPRDILGIRSLKSAIAEIDEELAHLKEVL